MGAWSLVALAITVVAVGSDAPGTTTYRWVDAQGVVHFSDTPQPGAQQLQIQPAQTYRAPAVAPSAASPTTRPSEPPSRSPYQSCAIVQPETEQSFYAPEDIPVSVRLDPPLRGDDQVSVAFDGQPLMPTDGSTLHYRVTAPDRGEHTLTASVHDAAGQLVCSSSALTFYVQRPSLHSPQSPARSH